MAGKNNRVIVDALKEMAHARAQVNESLQSNQNQNGKANGFYGLEKFQKNNLPTFKGRYDPKVAQTWIQEIENISRVMVCIDTQKVLFGPHMLFDEAEY